MKKRTCVLILLVSLFVLPHGLFAVLGVGGGAAPFLRTGVGARALALSGAFTAWYDDAAASYWNPAAMPCLKQTALSTMISWLTEERAYNYLSATFPSEYGSFAVSFINFSAGELEGRSADTEEYYTFTDSENAYFFSYGKEIVEKISAGATLKVLNNSLDTYSAWGLSLDAALLIRFTQSVSFGLVLQDIAGTLSWSTGTTEQIPMLLRAGVLAQFMDNTLKTSFDAEENEFEGVTFKAGVEQMLFNVLSLRAGCSYGASNYRFDYTFGGGLKYAISKFTLQLDYGFLKEEFYSSYEANHKLSLNLYFPM
ncbi:MAG: PorV/PorQ family protein [Spirochaetia bacterium]|nr:PorV/PorQ family protein [Spirochaetia bacterium]